MIITIDGPTASGKSSIARMLAKELNCYYLYSGLLYRALGYLLVRDYSYTLPKLQQPELADVPAVLSTISYFYDAQQGAQIIVAGQVITLMLKTAEVDTYAAVISAHPEVRAEILQFQRMLAKNHILIADGRDCGTVVFPHAEHKFFLTAQLEVRALRWQRDQARLGKDLSFEDCLQAVSMRDGQDTNRAHSPLIVAPDAQVIDNSALNLDQTLELFKEKIAGKMYQVPEFQETSL